MAQEAFTVLSKKKKIEDEYRSFALSFPALIHDCGLVQSLAFAQAKNRKDYLNDLAAVFSATGLKIGADELLESSRTADIAEYMRLSELALDAASWLKRYTVALYEDMKK